MKRNIYANIKTFGQSKESLEVENPLSYCVNWNADQSFLHGGNSYIYGQYSKPCQSFLSDYCADKWDKFCEVASHNQNISYPNQLNTNVGVNVGLTAGEILIRNTASKKYLISMSGNCVQKFQAFDPTVANSPMISYWDSEDYEDSGISGTNSCVPKYAVDAKTIDNDIVMDKLLEKPSVGMDILLNIFNTMKDNKTLHTLQGTKIGKFFELYMRKQHK
jgi:hypothetical protein